MKLDARASHRAQRSHADHARRRAIRIEVANESDMAPVDDRVGQQPAPRAQRHRARAAAAARRATGRARRSTRCRARRRSAPFAATATWQSSDRVSACGTFDDATRVRRPSAAGRWSGMLVQRFDADPRDRMHHFVERLDRGDRGVHRRSTTRCVRMMTGTHGTSPVDRIACSR